MENLFYKEVFKRTINEWPSILTILLMLVALIVIENNCEAGELAFNFPCCSVHDDNKYDYNENNIGVSVEYGSLETHFFAGYLVDSFYYSNAFIGAGFRKELVPYVYGGFKLGIINKDGVYPGLNPLVTPTLMFGGKRIGVEITYVHGAAFKKANVVLFSLRYGY